MFIYKTAFDLIEPKHDLMRLLLHSQANRAGLGEETKCEQIVAPTIIVCWILSPCNPMHASRHLTFLAGGY